MLHRVLEKKESLRNVADDSGVSHEAIRRVVRAARCGSKASVEQICQVVSTAVLGQSGSANAQAALRGALSGIGAIVVPDPQVLVPQASRLFDEHVDLRDEDTREEIRDLVEAMAHWCRRVQPKEPVNAQSVTGS